MFTNNWSITSAALEAEWQPEVTYRHTDIAKSARSRCMSSYRWYWTAFRDWGRASSSSGRKDSPVKTLNSRKEKGTKVSGRSSSHSMFMPSCAFIAIQLDFSHISLSHKAYGRWKNTQAGFVNKACYILWNNKIFNFILMIFRWIV